ncbi:hypothetical protein FRC11_010474 [Ceratobasidium sp. 423]|nr:hypothetical protein FRC11_010474 [Ceratobasidium sp. 423]
MSTSSSTLFTPLQIGDITLAHRVVMAPLTRFRANDNHAHTELGVQYYAQRAEVPGTLLITEATPISPEAAGYDHVPGIWSDEQIEAWKKPDLPERLRKGAALTHYDHDTFYSPGPRGYVDYPKAGEVQA